MKCKKCGNEYDGKFCPECGAPSSENAGPEEPVKKPKKKKKTGKIILIVLAVIVVIVIASNLGKSDSGEDDPSAPAQQVEEIQEDVDVSPDPVPEVEAPVEQEQEPVEKPEAPEEPATISVNIDLGSGNYLVGTDIPAGRYNITAVSGGGNVSSSNMYSGGINAIMGTADKNSDGFDMYEQEYKNISLEDGVVLSISGVVVNLSCDAASGNPLTPRSQEISEIVELGNGNYIAGVDFPAGTYDIEAIEGGGNVSSTNIFSGGINAIMGTADKNSDGIVMYEQLYKNISLPDGETITISGVTIRLTPSK